MNEDTDKTAIYIISLLREKTKQIFTNYVCNQPAHAKEKKTKVYITFRRHIVYNVLIFSCVFVQ